MTQEDVQKQSVAAWTLSTCSCFIILIVVIIVQYLTGGQNQTKGTWKLQKEATFNEKAPG